MKIAYGHSPYSSIDEIELDALNQGYSLVVKHGIEMLVKNVDSTTLHENGGAAMEHQT